MRRKIVKQGSSSNTISLPKDWISRLDIKPGDELDIEESGTKLIISSIQKDRKHILKSFELDKIPENLVHEFMVSIYKQGVKDLELKNPTKEKTKKIKDILSTTIGFEMISQEREKLNLIDLGTVNNESIQKAEIQIFWRLLHMVDRVLDNNSKKEEIWEIDLEINKLSLFIQRNLSTKFSNNPNNFILYEKISILEGIGDYLRSIKIYSKPSENKKFLEKISEILELFKQQGQDIEYFVELKEQIGILKQLAGKIKKNKEVDYKLGFIMIYKNIRQLFEACFALNLENLLKDGYEIN